MSKHKRKKGKVIRKDKNITMTKYDNETQVDNTPKKWYHKKWAQRLIALSIGTILAVPMWVLLGSLSSKLHGYADQQDMIKSTLLAIDLSNKTKINLAFEPNIPSMKDDVVAYANAIHDTIDMDLDSVYTDFISTDIDVSILADNIKKTPDKAMSTIASIDTKKKSNDGTSYECITVYEITSYEINNKWFISGFIEIGSEIIDLDTSFNETNLMGEDTLGWMNAGNTSWKSYPVENTLFEKADTLCFECISNSTNYTANIIISKLNGITSIDDAETKILDNLEKDNDYLGLTVIDGTLNNIPCRRIMGITISEQGMPVTSYTWLFKNSLNDPYVHQITLNTTNSEQTYPIIMSYYL